MATQANLLNKMVFLFKYPQLLKKKFFTAYAVKGNTLKVNITIYMKNL